MAAAAVPLLYNRLRLDYAEWSWDPLAATPTGVLVIGTTAWSTAGPIVMEDTITTLGPDNDPTTAIGTVITARHAFLVAAGFTLALDPAGYNP